MRWSTWRPFPDPRKGGILSAPLGPGVYDLRRRGSKKPVLFGIGGRCAQRMTSILPAPLGTGSRNNDRKRAYVLRHLSDIEYRTRPTSTRKQAADIEREIKQTRGSRYSFKT